MERIDNFKKDSKKAGQKVEEAIKDPGRNYGGTAGGSDISKQNDNSNTDKLNDQAKSAFEKFKEDH
jgi:hypothetical protein